MKTYFLLTVLLLIIFRVSTPAYSQKSKAGPAEILEFYKQEAKLVNLNQGDTLLDIGAGSGMVNAIYSVLYNNLHQVLTDVDSKMLSNKNVKHSFKSLSKQYKSNNEYTLELLVNQQDAIPLSGSSFNKILCRRSFHEFTRREAMLREIHRIVRDTGTVVVIEGLPQHPGDIDKECKMPYLTADKIIHAFTESGFALVSQNEEVMEFDNNRKLTVLTFSKSKRLQ